MAGSNKKVKQQVIPRSRVVKQGGNPERYYDEHPSWNFSNCDPERWTFSQEHLGDAFWTEVFPRLQAWGNQRWKDILLIAKKHNHSILIEELNKDAQKRLDELHIERDAVISLSLCGTHRIYGYMEGSALTILWYDDNHGNNDDCVCRSNLKHT